MWIFIRVLNMDEEGDTQCFYCGHIFPFVFRICPNCGKRHWICPHCGHRYTYNFRICPHCGKKYVEPM